MFVILTYIEHVIYYYSPRKRRSCQRACKVALVCDCEYPESHNLTHCGFVLEKVQMLRQHMRDQVLQRQIIGNVCVAVPNLHYGIPI